MALTNINKIENIDGENIYIFQFIDENGNLSELRQTISDFFQSHPLLIEKDYRIKDLEYEITLLIENKGLLDEKVISQSKIIEDHKKEKNLLEEKIESIINDIEGDAAKKLPDAYLNANKKAVMGEINEALDYLDEAELENEEKKVRLNSEKVAKSRFLKAQLLTMKNEYDEASTQYEKACELNPNWDFLKETCNHFKFLNKIKKAEEYSLKCLDHASSDTEKSSSLNIYGLVQRDLRNFDLARSSFQDGIDFFNHKQTESWDEVLLIGGLLTNLGNLLSDQEDFGEAEKKYLSAFELYENFNTDYDEKLKLFKFGILTNLGNLYAKFGSTEAYNLSLKYFLEASSLLDTIKDEENYLSYKSSILNSRGFLEYRNGELDKAEKLYLASLSEANKFVFKLPSSYLHQYETINANLGDLYLKKGNLKKASDYVKITLDINKTLVLDNPVFYEPKIRVHLSNLGKLNLKLGQVESAFRLLEEAMDLAAKVYLEKTEEGNLKSLIISKIDFADILVDYKNNLKRAESLIEEVISTLFSISYKTWTHTFIQMASLVKVKIATKKNN